MVNQGSYDLRRDVDVLKRKVDDGIVDSESYFIQASTPVVTYATGFSPSSITFRGYKILNGFTDLFPCTLRIYGSNDGSSYTQNPIKQTDNTSSITHTVTTEYSYYRCEMVYEDNVLDYQTVRVISASEASPVVFLGNESQLIPCDTEGQLISPITFKVPYYCYKGVGKYPCQFSRAGSDIPTWLTYTNTDATSSNPGELEITVNSTPSRNHGFLVLAFKVDDETIYCIFNYSRTREGTDGKDGSDGNDGVDGDGYHYIYYRTTTNVKPTTPTEDTTIIYDTTIEGLDLDGTEWFEEIIGTTAQYPYLWCSFRVFNGVESRWGDYCDPYLMEQYTYYGSDGDIGENGLHGADGNTLTGDDIKDKVTDVSSSVMEDSVPSNFVSGEILEETIQIGDYKTHIFRQGNIVGINLRGTKQSSTTVDNDYVQLITLPQWAYPLYDVFFPDAVHIADEHLRYRIRTENGVPTLSYFNYTTAPRNLYISSSVMYIVDDTLRPSTKLTNLSGTMIGQGEAFAVQLLDDEDNPLPQKTLYFKVNGIIYKRETNLAGLATLNMNNSGDQEVAVWYDGYEYDNGEITTLNTTHTKCQGIFNIYVRPAFVKTIDWGKDDERGYYVEIRTNTNIPLRYHTASMSINGSSKWKVQTDGDGRVYFDLMGYADDVEVLVTIPESNRVYETISEKHIFLINFEETYIEDFYPTSVDANANFEDLDPKYVSSIGDMKFFKTVEIPYNQSLAPLVLNYDDLNIPLSAVIQHITVQAIFCGLEGTKPMNRPSWKAPKVELEVNGVTAELEGRPSSVICNYDNCGKWKIVNYNSTLANSDISPGNVDGSWKNIKLTLSDLTNLGGGDSHKDKGRFALDYLRLRIEYSVNNDATLIPSNIPSTNVYCEDVEVYEKSSSRYYAKLVINDEPVANKTLKFNLLGSEYNRTTDSKGQASMLINLSSGNYPITISYSDDETTVTKSAIIKIKPRIISNSLTKSYGCNSQYMVTLLDENGNVAPNEEVVFNINNVNYTRTSDEYGKVKININLIPGTHIVTTTWEDVQKSDEIVILQNIHTSDLVMKYVDGSKFVANITDCQGEPLVGGKVEFNINGVIYERTTDEYGDAKITINLPVGHYIVSTSYDRLNTVTNQILVQA